MTTALEVVREWKERMRAHDFEHLGEIVDLDSYTEICLGLTGWTTGYDVALQNYIKNMVQPWTDLEVKEDQVVDGPETVVTRSHTRATHAGEFLGIPGTGRRVEWDAITMIQIKEGRVVGQSAQPDLFSIYRQISDREVHGVARLSAPVHGRGRGRGHRHACTAPRRQSPFRRSG